LPVADAYRLWAPRYDEETVLSALEARAVAQYAGPVEGRMLLDAGCGTGRRRPPLDAGFHCVVGVDLVPEMLAEGRRRRGAGPLLAAADVRALPLSSGLFDLLWFRLAIGHLVDLAEAYRELERVAAPAARLIVSDMHPAAIAAGHTRTFHDVTGQLRHVEHHVHSLAEQRRTAGLAGWRVDRIVEVSAGRQELPFYERAGRLEQFERERDLPLVLILCLHR
jgi:malonyl-CoA O-methyltransferase